MFEYDSKLAREILSQIYHSVEIILDRFQSIENVNNFTDSPQGMEKLDSICMQLIVIGEGLKNFDKVTNKSVLCNYPEIEWKKVRGLRDIIIHHYIDINAEAIYDICENKLLPLKEVMEKIVKDIK